MGYLIHTKIKKLDCNKSRLFLCPQTVSTITMGSIISGGYSFKEIDRATESLFTISTECKYLPGKTAMTNNNDISLKHNRTTKKSNVNIRTYPHSFRLSDRNNITVSTNRRDPAFRLAGSMVQLVTPPVSLKPFLASHQRVWAVSVTSSDLCRFMT